MVHIIAAILKIRQTVGVRWEILFSLFVYFVLLFFSWMGFSIFFCSQESQELIDAELSARVLKLISMTDTGAHAQVRWNWFVHLIWMRSYGIHIPWVLFVDVEWVHA
jgi:exportin-7